jgi:hypothetical protein
LEAGIPALDSSFLQPSHLRTRTQTVALEQVVIHYGGATAWESHKFRLCATQLPYYRCSPRAFAKTLAKAMTNNAPSNGREKNELQIRICVWLVQGKIFLFLNDSQKALRNNAAWC